MRANHDSLEKPLIHMNALDFRYITGIYITTWRHQMETFSALLAHYVGNIPLTKASDAELWFFFFNMRLNHRLNTSQLSDKIGLQKAVPFP